ncbi:MAG: sulfatase, partial [Vicinamibacterales bacterium]
MARADTKMWLVALAGSGLIACSGAPTRERPRPTRNILIVTIDTLRADRLGRGFTPALDHLAAQSLSFTNTRSVAPMTGPSHSTIFTGLLPPSHGVRLNGQSLATGASTMAQRLKQAGYQTSGVVAAFVLDRRFGFGAGFDQYDDAINRDPGAVDRLQADRSASDVTDRSIAALNRLSTDQPWLLWVHFYDPHAPYDPPADARARAGGDGYNGEIAYVDEQVGRVIAATGARADASRLVTLIMADHGESLGDHGEATHGMLLTDAALRVPLIIHVPGQPPATRADPASLLDVLPTVLALCSQTPGSLPGRVLTGPPAPEAEAYAETTYPVVAGWSPMQSLVQDRWKLVRAERPRLFDLATDPGEMADLAASRSSVVRAMSAQLDAMGTVDSTGPPGARVSSDTVERLRALGYVAQA